MWGISATTGESAAQWQPVAGGRPPTRRWAWRPAAPCAGAGSQQLWCAKKAIYIQLWPLGTIKVEKSKKGAVKKLRPKNRLGSTNEAYFPALLS